MLAVVLWYDAIDQLAAIRYGNGTNLYVTVSPILKLRVGDKVRFKLNKDNRAYLTLEL